MWQWICRKILEWKGISIKIRFEEWPDQCVVAVAPHTSNWDFVYGIMIRVAIGEMLHYIGKNSLFRWPIGGLFRALGGIPVDRSKSHNYVDAMADVFAKEKVFRLVLAPEGTRSKVTKLKTGFYHIAKKAGVPIILCAFDFQRNCVVLNTPFYVTDDETADFTYIKSFFKDIRGFRPEKSFF